MVIVFVYNLHHAHLHMYTTLQLQESTRFQMLKPQQETNTHDLRQRQTIYLGYSRLSSIKIGFELTFANQ